MLSRRVKVGDVAGGVASTGYIMVGVEGKTYLAHRLAWLYVHGYFPENVIDHINRTPLDNRLCNLREVAYQCNTRNSSVQENNTSGVRGVTWNKQKERWIVHLAIKRKISHVHSGIDFTEAVAHRLAAEQCLDWGDCDASTSAAQHMAKYLKDSK